jgi:DNA-binding response OmpR family regulator
MAGMQTILILGEGERAEQMAQELGDIGYQIEVRPFAATAEGIGAGVAAIVADMSSAGDSVSLAVAAGGGAEKRPVLAVLPEGSLAGEPLHVAADDFAFYPLRSHELETRLRRLLDRHGPLDSPDVLYQGALAVDTAGYRVFVDGVLVELTFKEYELLRFLAMHPDRVYTREALLDKVWGYDYFGGARTVDVHIRRIRSKIERGGLTFIETVRSVGYRFHASP